MAVVGATTTTITTTAAEAVVGAVTETIVPLPRPGSRPMTEPCQHPARVLELPVVAAEEGVSKDYQVTLTCIVDELVAQYFLLIL